jgi:hypothetical protein
LGLGHDPETHEAGGVKFAANDPGNLTTCDTGGMTADERRHGDELLGGGEDVESILNRSAKLSKGTEETASEIISSHRKG